MKSSKRILLVTGGIVMVGVIVSLVVVRDVAIQFIRKTEAESNYKTVPVTDFERVDFSANWNVRIRQGNEYKVELAAGDSSLKPKLTNIDGTLYFDAGSTDSLANTTSLFAKITTPYLKGVKARRGTTISLENFQADSIDLVLEDGNTFTGYNNQFSYVLFKTSGAVSLRLTDDGVMK